MSGRMQKRRVERTKVRNEGSKTEGMEKDRNVFKSAEAPWRNSGTINMELKQLRHTFSVWFGSLFCGCYCGERHLISRFIMTIQFQRDFHSKCTNFGRKITRVLGQADRKKKKNHKSKSAAASTHRF